MNTTSTLAKKVMVVEDESVISLDIRNSLTKLGYAVSGTAASGDSALKKIEKNRPDVILMDIHLKGEMTGIDVSRKVKSDFQIPVVYLTANADDSTFKAAQHTDPFGFVLKPFDEKELGIAIEIALNKHRKEQAVRSSESWYATAFQSLSEAVVATDPHGHIVFMNAAAESITKWSLSEAINLPVTDVLRIIRKIQQFDRIGPAQSINSILRTVILEKTDVPFSYDTQLAVKNSQYVAIRGKATALEDSLGHVIGGLFMFEPIRSEVLSAGKDKRSLERQLKAEKTSSLPKELKDTATRGKKASSEESDVELIDKADVELIEAFTHAFIQKQTFAASTANLVASSGEDWARLTSRNDGAIVKVKSTKNELTAVVKDKTMHEPLICHFLIENSFFPVRRRTNGDCHYQCCKIPEHCQVYRTEATELWEAWHGKSMPGQLSSDRVRYPILRENIVVFRRGGWYRIQKIALAKGSLHVKTIDGEIYAASSDPLIWGIQSY